MSGGRPPTNRGTRDRTGAGRNYRLPITLLTPAAILAVAILTISLRNSALLTHPVVLAALVVACVWSARVAWVTLR